MSNRMTSVCLPGLPGGAGFADWGRKSPAEMIANLRALAKINKEHAEAILAATDSDFRVETYTGIHVQRNREVLQEGKSHV